MVCYLVPSIALLVHELAGKKRGTDREKAHEQLRLLLGGGTIFGIVDHWWNNQLLFIGPNPTRDILLGVLITVAIAGIWFLFQRTEKTRITALQKA